MAPPPNSPTAEFFHHLQKCADHHHHQAQTILSPFDSQPDENPPPPSEQTLHAIYAPYLSTLTSAYQLCTTLDIPPTQHDDLADQLSPHAYTLISLINLDRQRMCLTHNLPFWPFPSESGPTYFFIDTHLAATTTYAVRRLVCVEAAGGVAGLGTRVPRYTNIVGEGAVDVAGHASLTAWPVLREGVGAWDLRLFLWLVGALGRMEAEWDGRVQDLLLERVAASCSIDVGSLVERVDVQAEEECPICRDGKRLRAETRCGHRFCGDCLELWVNRSEGAFSRCPVCRTRLFGLQDCPLGDVRKCAREYSEEFEMEHGRKLDGEVDQWLLDCSRIEVESGHVEDPDFGKLLQRLWGRWDNLEFRRMEVVETVNKHIGGRSN
ncbi:hypothetical protein BS50DRAFT_671530 [Corynespora cassiicola Philippines]|uniref:RING-type domain-containing protein n=1 Tax=Corynespora cassiicola Philippines TaxID=1448308 RepID=A0A2T2PCJ5_CORCC|nr:hypothetical protein BS50DRAFT_671530 [Corynespora cassiicola Philippines]